MAYTDHMFGYGIMRLKVYRSGSVNCIWEIPGKIREAAGAVHCSPIISFDSAWTIELLILQLIIFSCFLKNLCNRCRL